MKIFRSVSYSIRAELFQLVFMFLSISHSPVGFKGAMEKITRTARLHRRKSVSEERILSPRD
jgi:hypothetical protein